jgi:putative ABC transport system permease protein
VDAGRAAALYAALKRLPAVGGVGVRRAAIVSFQQTIAQSFRISLVTIIAFATAIAAGVVYNGARVALSERGRELVSLRVLGFTRGEVATMLLGEQALLTAVALPLGALAGLGFCVLLMRRFESDLFRIPLIVSPVTYAFGALVVVLASALSAGVVPRRLARLDLVQVLKTRE